MKPEIVECVTHATGNGVFHGCGFCGPGEPGERCAACGEGTLNLAWPPSPGNEERGTATCPICGAVAHREVPDWWARMKDGLPVALKGLCPIHGPGKAYLFQEGCPDCLLAATTIWTGGDDPC